MPLVVSVESLGGYEGCARQAYFDFDPVGLSGVSIAAHTYNGASSVVGVLVECVIGLVLLQPVKSPESVFAARPGGASVQG